MGVFISTYHGLPSTSIFFLVGIPLLAIGDYECKRRSHDQYVLTCLLKGTLTWRHHIQLSIGTIFLIIGCICAWQHFWNPSNSNDSMEMKNRNGNVNDDEFLTPAILVERIKTFVEQVHSNQKTSRDTSHQVKNNSILAIAHDDDAIATNVISVLTQLTRMCVRNEQQCQQEHVLLNKNQLQSSSKNHVLSTFTQSSTYSLALLSQEAAYMTLQAFPSNDSILSHAFSLLALVAHDPFVRQRCCDHEDLYGIDIPISILRTSLQRVKRLDQDSIEVETEQLSASVQRKGSLFLGAIADGDLVITTRIVEQDGLSVILDSSDWYRYHNEVTKWALWAVFVLCYDHPINKKKLIEIEGIPRICRVMKDIPDCLEVARHGVAILFDSLRDDGMTSTTTNGQCTLVDMNKIRLVALNAGLHEILCQAVTRFPSSNEIRMMATQMLAATGYKGDMPCMESTS